MSKIVTFEQANRLEKLGYDTTKLTITTVNGLFTHTERPIPVHEALDWIREEKGIDCCAFFNNELFGNLDNAKAIYYFKYGCNGRMIYNSWNVDYKSFDTHFLAESALLDAVLTYLEKK